MALALVNVLFHNAEGRAVFNEQVGVARMARVEVSAEMAWIEHGLQPGVRVIIHPDDRVSEQRSIQEERSRGTMSGP